MQWKPINLNELKNKIQIEEKNLSKDNLYLWKKIKIIPEKWTQDPWGEKGNGFWVVAIIGKKCLYYNDIEDGFNWSQYNEYGIIQDYMCDQDTIGFAMEKMFQNKVSIHRLGPPKNI